MAHFPLNPIKIVFRRYCKGPISDDALREIRDIVDSIVNDICKNSVEQFDQYNNDREFQGLTKKKRLDAIAVKRSIPVVANNLYKRFSITYMGLQSKETIVNPGGKKVSMDKPTAMPDKTTNDPGEVA